MEVRRAIVGHSTSEENIKAYTTYDPGVLAGAVQKVSYGDLDKLIESSGGPGVSLVISGRLNLDED